MTTPIERLRAWLDAGREIESAATPGPWRRSEANLVTQTAHITRDVWTIAKTYNGMAMSKDRDFIADARTRVRVQREVIEELLKALNLDREYYEAKPHKTSEVWDAIDDALDRAARLVEGKKL